MQQIIRFANVENHIVLMLLLLLSRLENKNSRKRPKLYLRPKETLDSLVNQTLQTLCVQVARERRTRTRRKITYKNKVGRSEAVTSPALFIL